MQFKLFLPQSFQHLSIEDANEEFWQHPPLDGYVAFYFCIVRDAFRTKKLIAFVEFDRELELDEVVLLRLKYNAAPTTLDRFDIRGQKRFNIAPQQSTK